jgi:hypothetical protein
MRRATRAWPYARAFYELIRYDVLFALGGLRWVRPAKRGRKLAGSGDVAVESSICETLAAVAPFYWKPIRCLQRSIVIARIMRAHGIPAKAVIGYRAMPFFSHAWVEVGGRAVSDSPVYQKRLLILERL